MKDFFLFKNRDVVLKIKVDNIVYFESNGNYTNIYTLNKKKSTVYMSLGHIEEVIKDINNEISNNFIRIGRTFIVNKCYICCIDKLKRNLVLSDSRNFSVDLQCSKDALKLARFSVEELDDYVLFNVEKDDSSAKP